VGKRGAGHKTEADVELVGGRKVGHRAGLQAQSAVAAPLGFVEYVLDELGGNPTAAKGVCGAQGLELPVVGIQLFQGDTACERVALPDCPEGNLGLAQARKVQRMLTLGWGEGLQLAQVLLQELGDLGASQVIYAYCHVRQLGLLYHGVEKDRIKMIGVCGITLLWNNTWV
jgi:hypothetical protein